jgi:hypothetical protein
VVNVGYEERDKMREDGRREDRGEKWMVRTKWIGIETQEILTEEAKEGARESPAEGGAGKVQREARSTR